MREIINEQDLRVLKTRKSLRDAYIRLVGKHKRSYLTVTNVTREAMVNRKTFYGHFSSIDDLLNDIEQVAVNDTIKNILTKMGGETDLSSALKGLAQVLDTDDPGLQALFFSPEYSDFQTKYMDDVLSSQAFAPFTEMADQPWLVRGYLSAFLGLFDQWRQTRGDKSLDEFVDYTAQLFEHGISSSHTAKNN